jgi:hypothetical protein
LVARVLEGEVLAPKVEVEVQNVAVPAEVDAAGLVRVRVGIVLARSEDEVAVRERRLAEALVDAGEGPVALGGRVPEGFARAGGEQGDGGAVWSRGDRVVARDVGVGVDDVEHVDVDVVVFFRHLLEDVDPALGGERGAGAGAGAGSHRGRLSRSLS